MFPWQQREKGEVFHPDWVFAPIQWCALTRGVVCAFWPLLPGASPGSQLCLVVVLVVSSFQALMLAVTFYIVTTGLNCMIVTFYCIQICTHFSLCGICS